MERVREREREGEIKKKRESWCDDEMERERGNE